GRHGVPVLRDLAAHDGRGERGLPAEGAPPARRGDSRAGSGGARASGAGRARTAAVAAPQRRPAAARGPRPRPGHQSPPAAARRAVQQPRREAARADARGAEAAPEAAQHRRAVRDPRPDGGAESLRSRRADERGPRRAGGPAPRPVLPARERVRARLHRQGGAVPRPGPASRAGRRGHRGAGGHHGAGNPGGSHGRRPLAGGPARARRRAAREHPAPSAGRRRPAGGGPARGRRRGAVLGRSHGVPGPGRRPGHDPRLRLGPGAAGRGRRRVSHVPPGHRHALGGITVFQQQCAGRGQLVADHARRGTGRTPAEYGGRAAMGIAKQVAALVVLVLVSACGPGGAANPAAGGAGSAPKAAAPALTPERERLLRDLVARANQEGALEAEVADSAMPAAGAMRDAFLSRFAPFGLNVSVNVGAGQQPTIWNNAQAAIAAGGAPQFDAMLGQDDTEVLPRLKDGMLQPMANWQELLAAIDPLVADGTVKAEDRSPGPLAGYGIHFDDRLKIILFNPEVMPKDQLPKTYLDLADPRYKGKFAVPP